MQENNKTECACLKFADDIGTKTYKEYRADIPIDNYVKVRARLSIHAAGLAPPLSASAMLPLVSLSCHALS